MTKMFTVYLMIIITISQQWIKHYVNIFSLFHKTRMFGALRAPPFCSRKGLEGPSGPIKAFVAYWGPFGPFERPSVPTGDPLGPQL